MRERALDQGGFTLIELIVVTLILAILALIAMPTYGSQRDKAEDASMKSLAHIAQQTIETYALSTLGYYTGANRNVLKQLEPSLHQLPGNRLIVNAPRGSDLYRVGARSTNGNRFFITRLADGSVSFTCTVAGRGGCPAGGVWGAAQ